MTIFIGSRHEFDPVDRVLGRDGEYHAAVFRKPGPTLRRFDYVTYLVHEGDRLDTLAARFYGDSELWWMIADANPEHFDPETITRPGTVLRVPYAPS